MRTIYEKEALFESLDAAVAELKEYIVGAVHRAELHQVEQQMFRQLQQAVLAQRAVVKNGDWDSFFTYYIDAERDRLYPTIYERENAYQRAA